MTLFSSAKSWQTHHLVCSSVAKRSTDVSSCSGKFLNAEGKPAAMHWSLTQCLRASSVSPCPLCAFLANVVVPQHLIN